MANLEQLWTSAPVGKMTPMEQMKAWALREAQKEVTVKNTHGQVNYQWIADRVQVKSADGKVERPTKNAIKDLVGKMDSDPSWYPGKRYGTKRPGPAPLLHKAKRNCIASSMMAAKDQGLEPNTTLAIQRCQKACINPLTQMPFHKKYLARVLREDCYDEDPSDPWRYDRVLQKTWLPEPVKKERYKWALQERKVIEANTPVWYFNNVIWFDPNSTVMPHGPKKAADQKQVAKGTMRWLSKKSKMYSRNMAGPKYAKSQCGWGDQRFHWILVLTRGRIAVEVMPEGWTPNAQGMASFIALLPRVLNTMLGKTAQKPNVIVNRASSGTDPQKPKSIAKPKVVFTDRGSGMYVGRTGVATGAYSNAINSHGFRLYSGEDASNQPADLADVLLHESAISTFRSRLTATPPVVKPWKETHAQFKQRIAKVAAEANKLGKWNRLCCEYPERIELLIDKKGDRLRK